MKILVIGLDGAAPDLLFNDERLTNFRRLMEFGCYGRLKSVIPPIRVPVWECMAASQDPGSLGMYGLHNRPDYSYNGLEAVNPLSIQEPTLWDQVGREGKRAVIIGVPPSYPPRKVNGVSVGCCLTPDTSEDIYTYPPAVKEEIANLVGEYPVDVRGFSANSKDGLKDEVYAMSRKHFQVVRHFLQNAEWDYFQFIEIGLDRLQHGFWQFHDSQHVLYEPGNPYEDVIRHYYLYLDDELGRILEVLSDDTAIMVVSGYGAQRLDGGFCLNEWLVKESLLVLNEYPKEITPFSQLNVNWEKTKVWSEDGSCGRLDFNVKGREPHGTIEPGDYETFRDEVKALLEATVNDQNQRLGTVVFKPEEIYRTVRHGAPDLMVQFGDHWRSVSSVGHQIIHTRQCDTGQDGCNHAPFGSFILAATNNPLQGEIDGAHLIDIAPTLLELGGYDVPASMQGTSLVAGRTLGAVENTSFSADEEEIIRQRLHGLGYIA